MELPLVHAAAIIGVVTRSLIRHHRACTATFFAIISPVVIHHLFAGMEGYLRPGCVHVTLQAIVDQNTHETSVSGGIANVVRQLIARAALVMLCAQNAGLQLNVQFLHGSAAA